MWARCCLRQQGAAEAARYHSLAAEPIVPPSSAPGQQGAEPGDMGRAPCHVPLATCQRAMPGSPAPTPPCHAAGCPLPPTPSPRSARPTSAGGTAPRCRQPPHALLPPRPAPRPHPHLLPSWHATWPTAQDSHTCARLRRPLGCPAPCEHRWRPSSLLLSTNTGFHGPECMCAASSLGTALQGRPGCSGSSRHRQAPTQEAQLPLPCTPQCTCTSTAVPSLIAGGAALARMPSSNRARPGVPLPAPAGQSCREGAHAALHFRAVLG